jgi:flagellar hook assembly protein FlgD
MQTFWNPTAVQGTGTAAASFFSDTVRNYPNPFQLGPGSTKFVVLTNEAGTVDIRIYDAGGQFVTSFSRTVTGAGRSEVVWDGHNSQGSLVSSGLYIARVHGHSTAHDETQYRRVVGVK